MPAKEEEFSAEVAAARLTEGKKLIDEYPEKAVGVLCDIVKMYEGAYGRGALECAPAYLQYGIALYEVARSSMNELGSSKTTVDRPSDAKPTSAAEAGLSASTAGANTPGSSTAAEAAPSADQDAPSDKPADDGKPKDDANAKPGSPAAAIPEGAGGGPDGKDKEDADGKEEEEEESSDGEEAEEESDGERDMMVAWETLELARVIFTKNQPEKHAHYLADVYKGLGDIKAAEEQFEDAVEAYRQSIVCLQSLQPPAPRRLAEVQYSLSIVLTYLDQPEAALVQTRAALKGLEAAAADIEEKLSALPLDGSGGEAAEEEGRRLQATADDLQSVMAELQCNIEGLERTAEHNNSYRETLRHLFQSATRDPITGKDAAAAVVAALSGTIATALPTTSNVASLGVVGRGTKRLNLQPVPASGQAQQLPSLGSAAAAPLAPPGGVTGKRSLADLMGGGPPASGGETAVGFGAVAVVEKRALEPQLQAKKARAEEPQGIAEGAPAQPGAGAAEKASGDSGTAVEATTAGAQ